MQYAEIHILHYGFFVVFHWQFQSRVTLFNANELTSAIIINFGRVLNIIRCKLQTFQRTSSEVINISHYQELHRVQCLVAHSLKLCNAKNSCYRFVFVSTHESHGSLGHYRNPNPLLIKPCLLSARVKA